MKKLLHIDSSVLGPHSVSRQVSAAIIERLRQTAPDLEVAYRDLTTTPLAHLSGAHLAAAQGAASPDMGLAADITVGQEVLNEFLAADTVVLGAPMYNFTIPSQLKAWLDRLGVPGVTFSYSEAGPQGLAGGRQVIVASSQGGAYDLDAPFEHHESYLRDFLAFIGIADPVFVRANRIGFGPDVREVALAAARETIAQLEGPPERLAA